jgi:hypothetical protein
MDIILNGLYVDVIVDFNPSLRTTVYFAENLPGQKYEKILMRHGILKGEI